MANQSITINFSKAEEDSEISGGCPSVLEQGPIEETYMTKIDLIKALDGALFGTDQTEIDCGLDDQLAYLTALNSYSGSVEVGTAGVTSGNMGSPVRQSVEVTESVEFELNTEQSTQYPVSGIKSYEWSGDVYDQTGARVNPPPAIDMVGGEIIVSEPVYGTVTVIYTTIRVTRTVLVSPRVDSRGTAYDSVAWVVKDCGVELLTLTPPIGAESNLISNKNCWGGTGDGDTDIIGIGDGDDTPTADSKDIDIDIDYCTQLVNE